MDRRATLAALLGRKSSAQKTLTPPSVEAFTVVSGLEPYTGPWELEQAAHLLRRAMFGPTLAHIKETQANGLNSAVDQLLADQPLPGPPLNFYYESDPNAPVGATWVDAPYDPADTNYKTYRNKSLFGWNFGVLMNEGISAREKMTLFWHNHFVTGNIKDPKFNYDYIQFLRTHSLGDFRTFVEEVTVNPSMLRYLNGNQNTKTAPNENYARELLELFTIGKGPMIAPGDYSNYTEDDVVEIAKVLTGFYETGWFAEETDEGIGYVFDPDKHHTGQKQLSYHFNNAIIENEGENEYKTLIDIILQQSEVARFVCRKLYRWFVFHEITPQIEADIIEPMAQIFIDNNWEIKPVLDALFKSAHFYDSSMVGGLIKNPIDYVMSIVKSFEVEVVDDDIFKQYRAWDGMNSVLPDMQMEYFQPPSVAGWKAYYQEPTFYRIWINSVTLNARMSFANMMATTGFGTAGEQVRIDLLKFLDQVDNPEDPNAVIDAFVLVLFPYGVTANQYSQLKEVLIPGLPDFEWTVEYNEYASDPTNTALAEAIEGKLHDLLQTMMGMSEFILS
jgi:uncharacterized protein (DUF1800 family)